MTGALGRRLDAAQHHDPRSLRYLVPATAVESKDWERRIPILDQGALGSCTGNAAVGALGTQPLYDALPEGTVLDEALAVRIYSEATKIDPYDGEYPPDDTGSDGLSVAKVCKRLGLISGYLHATSVDAMCRALQTGPVIVGVNWYEGFDQPDENGIAVVGGRLRGGHEFEVVGLDVKRRLFYAVNSWGRSWGQSGYFWFSFDDMARLLSEGGDCTQLLPATAPAPTPTPIPAADQAVLDAIEAWGKGIVSRFTKAGKLKAALSAWAKAHGYEVNGI